jgi:ATP-dependent protease ClpP protease subunit
VKQGQIYIHGVIGSYTDDDGQEIKGVELLDVISQVKRQPDATSFLVHIGSPGGLVDAGNQIYDYLLSLRNSGIRVDTITDSYINEKGEVRQGVGSIATKLFLAGEERSIIEGHQFFIHNPWAQLQPGDSKQIKIELKGLEATEAELRNFYQTHTKITESGLKGLMDKETGMGADHAVELGFATKKVAATRVKAFALHKSKNNMSTTIKALDLELEGGQRVSVSSEDPANLVGADAVIVDANGQAMPAPDGEHKLSDGRILVVMGGKVTEVKGDPAAAPAAAAPATTPPPTTTTPAPNPLAALEARFAALEQANAAQKAELDALKAVDVEAKIKAGVEAGINEFKNTAVAGQAPVKAFNNNGQVNGTKVFAFKSISDKMKEGQQKRREQLNKN